MDWVCALRALTARSRNDIVGVSLLTRNAAKRFKNMLQCYKYSKGFMAPARYQAPNSHKFTQHLLTRLSLCWYYLEAGMVTVTAGLRETCLLQNLSALVHASAFSPHIKSKVLRRCCGRKRKVLEEDIKKVLSLSLFDSRFGYTAWYRQLTTLMWPADL